MSYIDDLIQELCPDGMPYRALGEVGTIVRGKRFVKADMLISGVPCIHYGEIYTKYGVAASESISFVSAERATTLRFAEPGAVIMASAGETIEDIGKSVAWLGSESIAIHDACYAFTSDMDSKFVSYFFASRGFRDQIRQSISSSKISSISTQNVARARIPVPPLEVQREIVRILDQFTQLEAELEAELEARRLQYAHYRMLLVNVGGGATRSRLGDHVEFGGRIVSPERMPEANVSIYSLPAFDKGQGPELASPATVGSAKSRIQEATVLVAKLNPHIPRVWKLDKPPRGSYASPEFYQLVPSPDVSLDYLEHVIGANLSKLAGLVTGSTNSHKRLQREHIKNLVVRIPPLAQQHEISALLNDMGSLAEDLSVGLPAERAARRKQYEHYRDQLLTFEELPA